MKKMNLNFEVDGREIAKSIMNERIVKEMTLEERMKENKNKANAIADELNIVLDRKIDWYVDSEDIAEFHIHTSKYDYNVVKIKLLTQENRHYLNINEYVEIIKYMLVHRGLKNNLYTTYKASTLEKVIIDLIEEFEDTGFHVINGILCLDDDELLDLSDIEEYHVYNGEDAVLDIYTGLEKSPRMLIVFRENRVEEVE